MTTRHHYEVTFTHKGDPTIRFAGRFASSASEAKNMVKADEARRGKIAVIVACVKR